MEPARSIIARLGGAAVVARITETAYTAPYRWQYPRSKGGSGGLIPQKHHRKLIDYARMNGVDLEPADFSEATEGGRPA